MTAQLSRTHLSLGQSKIEDDYFSSVSHQIRNWLIGLTDFVLARMERGRDWTALAHMDRRELSDIGITRSDIESVIVARPGKKTRHTN